MHFILNINCNGEAFAEDSADEVTRLLQVAALVVHNKFSEGTLRDTTGNRVGEWRFVEDDDQ